MLGAELFVFILATVVIGAVVFGGTTLLYFLGQSTDDSSGSTGSKRREGDPVPVRVDSTHEHDRAA